MITISDGELEALLGDIESDRVERKESLSGDAPKKLREAICAFANDLPGHNKPGIAFVGVNDAGQPTGLEITDRLLQQLADMRSDANILPLPMLTVEKRRLRGHDVAVVVVAPADAPPVKFKGVIWIRVGPRRAIADRQEERVLNERRRFKDLPFDLQPIATATVSDLDRRLFMEDYLPVAVDPEVLAANHRTYEERLSSARMIAGVESPIPTLVGILVLAIRPRDFIPGAYIQFLRLDGVGLDAPIVDEDVIDGPLAQMLRKADEKLRANVRTAVDLTSGPSELRTRDYPIEALDQLLRNAVMHRTYEGTNAPVRVNWFADRIEILSPGGPYGVVNPRNFGRPGLTDYRNPSLAEAMKTLGFVQRFGVGIATARRALADNRNPELEWEVDDRNVLAVVRRRA